MGGATTSSVMGVSTVGRYDPAANAWSLVALMPTPRWGLGSAAVGTTLFALGGFGGSGFDYLGTVEAFGP